MNQIRTIGYDNELNPSFIKYLTLSLTEVTLQQNPTRLPVSLDSVIEDGEKRAEIKNNRPTTSQYVLDRLLLDYTRQTTEYLQKLVSAKEDMSDRVPLKWLNILPETMMGGVLGFTYLGENFMGRRADLTGKTARMVDIHKSIHTPDEYETRVLTDWIMQKTKMKYVR